MGINVSHHSIPAESSLNCMNQNIYYGSFTIAFTPEGPIIAWLDQFAIYNQHNIFFTYCPT